MMPPHFFDPTLAFGTELLFTILAVVFCFLIYFKTRESYELTKYKGIKYFRDAFLLLGLSYLLRFLFSILLLSKITFDFYLPRKIDALFFILPLGYLSTAALFYLIFSLIWKRFDNKKMIILGHSLAVLLPLASYLTRSPLILFHLQAALLVVAVVLVFSLHKEGKTFSQIKIIYFLVFALWLINLFIIDRRHPFSLEIIPQVISVLVFIAIYRKVSKWAK